MAQIFVNGSPLKDYMVALAGYIMNNAKENIVSGSFKKSCASPKNTKGHNDLIDLKNIGEKCDFILIKSKIKVF